MRREHGDAGVVRGRGDHFLGGACVVVAPMTTPTPTPRLLTRASASPTSPALDAEPPGLEPVPPAKHSSKVSPLHSLSFWLCSIVLNAYF